MPVVSENATIVILPHPSEIGFISMLTKMTTFFLVLAFSNGNPYQLSIFNPASLAKLRIVIEHDNGTSLQSNIFRLSEHTNRQVYFG